MKILKKKQVSAVIALLMLTFSLFAISIQSGNAANKVYAWIIVNPNPVGVTQGAQVSFWLADPPPTAAGASGDRWETFTVNIVKPDGNNETRSGFKSDAVGAAYFVYNPTAVGDYVFQMIFSGQTLTSIGQTYDPAISPPYTLTVQEEPVGGYKEEPFPTQFWTRPVLGTNLNWASITNNWLMPAYNQTARPFDSGGATLAEGIAPKSAHILWTKPIAFGGLVGGIYGNAFYHDGRSYEQYFHPPVIINGRIYYNTIGANEPDSTGEMGNMGIRCLDLYTGEEIFTIPNQTLYIGQIYNYMSPNQAGAYAYLWVQETGTTWKMYDAWTGNYILSISNIPSGVVTYGPSGEIIIYNLAYNQTTQYPNEWVLTKWNSTKVFPTPELGPINNPWTWRPYNWAGLTLNGQGTTNTIYGPLSTNGTQWQAKAKNESGQALTTFLQGGMFAQDAIVAISRGAMYLGPTGGTHFIGYSTTDGHFLWESDLTPPTGRPNDLVGVGSFLNTFESNGIYYSFIKQTLEWAAYDLKTGTLKWVSDPYEDPWGQYVPSVQAAYGKFYSGGYDGVIHAYDQTDGTELWQFYSGDAELLTPYGTWPWYGGLVIIDGVIFATTGEHGNGVQPLYQGEGIYAVDAETGKQVWNMSGWFEQPAISDGIMLSHNCYDNQIYAFGKGPSATTVTAPMTAITEGNKVLIQGTVTDQSPGAKDTPAISDEDMSAWMAHIYEQTQLPANAKGVNVTLTAIDPNGNLQTIGTVQSDISGQYAIDWTPPVPGMYTITATFGGSESYYGSYEETHMIVSEAPQATASPPPTQAPAPVEAYAIGSTIAIIVAIAVAVFIIKRR